MQKKKLFGTENTATSVDSFWENLKTRNGFKFTYHLVTISVFKITRELDTWLPYIS